MISTKRTYNRIRKLQVKRCIVCGNEFTAIRRDALYCSKSCAVTAHNDRIRTNEPEQWKKLLQKNAEKTRVRRNALKDAQKTLEQQRQETLRVEEEKRRIEQEKHHIEQEKKRIQRIQQIQQQIARLETEKSQAQSDEVYQQWRKEYLQNLYDDHSKLTDEVMAREKRAKEFFEERSYIHENVRYLYDRFNGSYQAHHIKPLETLKGRLREQGAYLLDMKNNPEQAEKELWERYNKSHKIRSINSTIEILKKDLSKLIKG